MVALNKEQSDCLTQSNSRTFALVVAYTVPQFWFSELDTILFSISIVHSCYRKDPLGVSNFSFKFALPLKWLFNGLVKDLMENYSQFLNMTSQCNKYHVNIWLIRRISSGLRFKSFPASWKGLQSFVTLKFTCVHAFSDTC